MSKLDVWRNCKRVVDRAPPMSLNLCLVRSGNASEVLRADEILLPSEWAGVLAVGENRKTALKPLTSEIRNALALVSSLVTFSLLPIL